MVFDKVIFGQVVFDKVIFDQVVFDKVIFDQVINPIPHLKIGYKRFCRKLTTFSFCNKLDIRVNVS
jgi:hypothetical protein